MVDNRAFDLAEKMHDAQRKPVTSSTAEGLELKRKVGLGSGVALIVGTMIGSGIFITPGGVLKRSGSVGLSLVMWAACGVLAVFGSLTYAELGTLNQRSGGEYAYYLDALGSIHPFWGPLPAFLYSWLIILFIKPAGMAASCLSVARYTVTPLMAALDVQLTDEDLDLLMKLVGLLYLGVTIAINCYSVSWTMWITKVFTVAKLAAIGVLIACGIYQLALGKTQYLEEGFEGTTTDFGTIALAFYGGLWAYDGWNNLNFVTEELQNPSVNLPRALIIGIPLVMVCYLAVNVAYLTALSPIELINSKAVAVDMGNRFLGPMAFIIPLSVVISTFGGIVGGGFSMGRITFASGREGHMVDVLSYIHIDKRTPIPALLFFALLSFVMILSQDLAGLIDFCMFALWISYVLSMILVLYLRKVRPDAPRPYKVPLLFPIVVIIVGSYLIVAPIISDPAVEYLFVLGAALLGFLFYVIFVYHKYSMGFMAPLTRIIQLILNVGPPVKSD